MAIVKNSDEKLFSISRLETFQVVIKLEWMSKMCCHPTTRHEGLRGQYILHHERIEKACSKEKKSVAGHWTLISMSPLISQPRRDKAMKIEHITD